MMRGGKAKAPDVKQSCQTKLYADMGQCELEIEDRPVGEVD